MIPRSTAPTLRLALTVLTFRRPDDLRAVLPLLIEQAERVVSTNDRIDQVQIVIVDNDPARSGESVVAEFGSGGMHYVSEPRPGIAAARNRGLAEAIDFDLLVFIDDDERPVEDWLELMVATYEQHQASGVAGAVVSEFDGELDPWIAAGGFFQRRRLPTGTRLEVAATNNLLLDLACVRSLELTFDEQYGLTGGEDTLFTRTLVSAGALLVWCNEAVVTDQVPRSRMNRGWVLRRALSSGNSWALTAVAIEDSAARRTTTRIRLLGDGLVRAAGGGARLTLGGISRSPEQRAKGLRTGARGVGMMLGVTGYKYQEYRRKKPGRGSAAA